MKTRIGYFDTHPLSQAAPRHKPKRQFIRTRAVSSTDGLAIHIGMRVRNPENCGNMHWGEKRAHGEKFRKAALGVERPLAVKHITFVRWAPGVFDDDGLVACMKWVRDAACKWLGLPNDGPNCGVTFSYEQHRQAEYGVTVRFA